MILKYLSNLRQFKLVENFYKTSRYASLRYATRSDGDSSIYLKLYSGTARHFLITVVYKNRNSKPTANSK